MSNNLHNDHFTSTRSHQTLVMIPWAHLSEEVASLYNFLSVCLWIQFSSDDQIGWRASSQDVEQQWSVYLRYVCVSAEQCQCSSSSEASSITKQPRSIFLPLSWSPATDQPATTSPRFIMRIVGPFDTITRQLPVLHRSRYDDNRQLNRTRIPRH